MYNRRPPYQYSQNFLASNHTIARLVGLCRFSPAATVVEIGAGSGQLTTSLAPLVSSGRLIAIEVDPSLFSKLTVRLKHYAHVELVRKDALLFNWKALPTGYTVVSNLPFSITSEMIHLIFNPLHSYCRQAYLILQKEAALMLGGARAGGIESKKSLLLAPFFTVNILSSLSRFDFQPPPTVSVVFVTIEERSRWMIQSKDVGLWQDYVAVISHDRVGFGVWKLVFPKRQRDFWSQYGFIPKRGIQSQTFDSCMRLFNSEVLGHSSQIMQITRLALEMRAHQSRLIKRYRTKLKS